LAPDKKDKDMPKSQTAVIPKNVFGAAPLPRLQVPVSTTLLQAAGLDAADLYRQLASGPDGLSAAQAEARLQQHGPNVLAKDMRPGIATLLLHSVLNPLVSHPADGLVGRVRGYGGLPRCLDDDPDDHPGGWTEALSGSKG
jgi:hypothetical protein